MTPLPEASASANSSPPTTSQTMPSDFSAPPPQIAATSVTDLPDSSMVRRNRSARSASDSSGRVRRRLTAL